MYSLTVSKDGDPCRSIVASVMWTYVVNALSTWNIENTNIRDLFFLLSSRLVVDWEGMCTITCTRTIQTSFLKKNQISMNCLCNCTLRLTTYCSSTKVWGGETPTSPGTPSWRSPTCPCCLTCCLLRADAQELLGNGQIFNYKAAFCVCVCVCKNCL